MTEISSTDVEFLAKAFDWLNDEPVSDTHVVARVIVVNPDDYEEVRGEFRFDAEAGTWNYYPKENS